MAQPVPFNGWMDSLKENGQGLSYTDFLLARQDELDRQRQNLFSRRCSGKKDTGNWRDALSTFEKKNLLAYLAQDSGDTGLRTHCLSQSAANGRGRSCKEGREMYTIVRSVSLHWTIGGGRDRMLVPSEIAALMGYPVCSATPATYWGKTPVADLHYPTFHRQVGNSHNPHIVALSILYAVCAIPMP
mmetsp:Transcript_69257/g.144634  ORF Transcript_69257/g.144634 Transcript_69257/m.144634 type:complete len:187 (-) Transcript_69257:27-587(-)